MMLSFQTSTRAKTLILLSSGFDEFTAVYLLGRIREAGFPVLLVGLQAGPVVSTHGVVIHPDCSLDQLTADTSCQLIVMTGEKRCAISLLADPRVHQLIHNTVTKDGFLVATGSATSVLKDMGILTTITNARFISAAGMEVPEFTAHLLHLLQEKSCSQ